MPIFTSQEGSIHISNCRHIRSFTVCIGVFAPANTQGCDYKLGTDLFAHLVYHPCHRKKYLKGESIICGQILVYFLLEYEYSR